MNNSEDMKNKFERCMCICMKTRYRLDVLQFCLTETMNSVRSSRASLRPWMQVVFISSTTGKHMAYGVGREKRLLLLVVPASLMCCASSSVLGERKQTKILPTSYGGYINNDTELY